MPSSQSLKHGLTLADNPTSTLGLTVGRHTPNAGTFIPRADAQSPPTMSFGPVDSSKTYLAVCLDMDAPFASFAILAPILHWIQTGLKQVSNNASSSGSTLESTDPAVVSWVSPAPPPGSGPHRYVVMLYEQPANFDVAWFGPEGGKQIDRLTRMRFDWDSWERRANLGKPIAANFFTSN